MNVICKECNRNKNHYAKGLCKTCYMKEYQKKTNFMAHKRYMQTNKGKSHTRKLLMEFKLIYNNLRINGCSICGSHTYLVFHHSNPKDKLFNISQGSTRRNKVLSDELDKCILLCLKCHKEVHKGLTK